MPEPTHEKGKAPIFRDSMARDAVLIVFYVAAVILPLWLATWLSFEAEGLVYDVDRNLGLAGFMILILQFVLAAQIKRI